MDMQTLGLSNVATSVYPLTGVVKYVQSMTLVNPGINNATLRIVYNDIGNQVNAAQGNTLDYALACNPTGMSKDPQAAGDPSAPPQALQAKYKPKS